MNKNSLNCVMERRVNEKGFSDLVLVFPNGEYHKFYFKGDNGTKHLYAIYKTNIEEQRRDVPLYLFFYIYLFLVNICRKQVFFYVSFMQAIYEESGFTTMEFEKSILDAYFNAVFISNFYFDSSELKAFKGEYPTEYKVLNAFYRVRSKLNKDLTIMKAVGEVQWFTLTFDNKHDRALITTKRKNAERFLNSVFAIYEMVEEFGNDNNRYHIHGFGIFKDNKGFEDFRQWPCRQKIENLTESKFKKKIKYLTDYAVKDLPRLRRSKSLNNLLHLEGDFKGLKNTFPRCYKCHISIAMLKLDYYNVFRDKTT